MHNWLDTILEAYIAYILTREYYFGRSDTDLKREETRKAKKRSNQATQALDSAQISNSGGKKDMALGSPTQDSVAKSPDRQGPMEMREVPKGSDEDKLHNPPGS